MCKFEYRQNDLPELLHSTCVVMLLHLNLEPHLDWLKGPGGIGQEDENRVNKKFVTSSTLIDMVPTWLTNCWFFVQQKIMASEGPHRCFCVNCIERWTIGRGCIVSVMNVVENDCGQSWECLSPCQCTLLDCEDFSFTKDWPFLLNYKGFSDKLFILGLNWVPPFMRIHRCHLSKNAAKDLPGTALLFVFETKDPLLLFLSFFSFTSFLFFLSFILLHNSPSLFLPLEPIFSSS